MSLAARMRSRSGQTYGPMKQVAAAATLEVPIDADVFELTGAATVTNLDPMVVMPGRQITMMNRGSGTITLTNTNEPTARGEMELGGSNINLLKEDCVILTQGNEGQWRRTATQGNN